MDSVSKHECTEETFRSRCRFIVFLKTVLSVFPPKPGFLAVLLSSRKLHCCPLAAPWSVGTLPSERCQNWMLYISARDILILKERCFMVLWATLLFDMFAFFFPNSTAVLTYIHSISNSLWCFDVFPQNYQSSSPHICAVDYSYSDVGFWLCCY